MSLLASPASSSWSSLSSRLPPPAFMVFSAAIFLMPASYAIKFILDVPDLVWVDPSAVLAGVALLLHLVSVRRASLALPILAGAAFVLLYGAASLVSLLGAPAWLPARLSLQTVLAEPVKLLLAFALFYLTFEFAKDRAYRWRMTLVFGYTAALQLLIALLMALAFYVRLPLPEVLRTYIDTYAWRQSVFLDGLVVFRLGGTFIESPPFGLYMLCALTITYYGYLEQRSRRLLLLAGAALVGVLLSLSLQGLMGLLAFAGIYLLGRSDLKPRSMTRWFLAGLNVGLIALLSLPVLGYLAFMVGNRATEMSQLTRAEAVLGTSFGERYYHTVTTLSALSQDAVHFLLGLGSRGYGYYASAVSRGVFPETVTPQLMFVDVLAASGVLGLALFCGWLLIVLQRTTALPHCYGVAVWCGAVAGNFAQANWKWLAFFFMLAFVAGTAQSYRQSRESVR